MCLSLELCVRVEQVFFQGFVHEQANQLDFRRGRDGARARSAEFGDFEALVEAEKAEAKARARAMAAVAQTKCCGSP